jgi:hypothetical protein
MKFLVERTSLGFSINVQPYRGAVAETVSPGISQWSIDISSIEELLQFIDEVECVVIYREDYGTEDLEKRPFILEIYDDYRE